MLESKLSKIIVSFFVIWLIILLPVEFAEALSYTTTPSATQVTHDTAVIQWASDEPANGTIFYGRTAPTNSVIETEATDAHTVELGGLLPSTTYVFYAIMTAGNETIRNPPGVSYLSFTTTQLPDTEAPHAPTNLQTINIGANQITIGWDRDPADDDIEEYKIYVDGQFRVTTKARSYTALDLDSETEYSLEVSAVDTSNNEGPKAGINVTTLSEHLRTIMMGIINVDVFGTTATIDWSTDFATNAQIMHGIEPTMDRTIVITELNTSHSINLTDLQQETNYSFVIRACDEFNNCVNSSIQTFSVGKLIELFLELDEPRINLTLEEDFFYYTSHEMNIRGRAAPNSDVTVYVNNQRKRFKRLYGETTFRFNGVSLDPSKEENLLKIIAIGPLGDNITIERKVLVDRMPPEIQNITIPGFTPDSTIDVSGNYTDDTEVIVNMYLLKKSLAFHVTEDENHDFPDYYTQQGEQTRLTADVKSVAEQIENGTTQRETVQNIFTWLQQNLNSANCGDTQPESRSRPAREIITSMCAVDDVDTAVAFAVLARAKGIPAKYVETVDADWADCVHRFGIESTSCIVKSHAFSEVYLEEE
jgi:hypothetical protein